MTKLILVVALLAADVLLQGTNSSPTKRNWDNELMKEILTESTNEIATKSTPPPDYNTEKPTEKEEKYHGRDEGEDKDDDKADFDAREEKPDKDKEKPDKEDQKNKNPNELEKESEKKNPETAGGENIIEGDIELTPAQAAAFKEGGWDAVAKSETWRRNHGVWSRYIPYEIDNIEQDERDALMSSITMLQDATCLHFFTRTDEPDYLKFVKPSKKMCSSPVGKQRGAQEIKLGRGCRSAIPAHEILHSLGRYHEQSRPDRNQYVTINWDNIKEDEDDNFDIHKTADTQHIPYDYGSVMHYGKKSFSKNDQPTIEPKQENVVIGQRDHLSAYDIQQINIRYCPERQVRLVECDTPNEGRVEVKWNDEWGTVCHDSFGRPDGSVICKYLGYPGLKRTYRNAHFGQGTGPIWFNNMHCKRSDYGPFSCRMDTIGENNCNHNKDAGITCHPNVRLAGRGSSSNQGRVEVYVGGRWGTVCDDGFGEQEANVICHQLGFRTGTACPDAHFGRGWWLPIRLDDLQCTGNEQQIAHCKSRPVGEHNCDHSEDASVICSN